VEDVEDHGGGGYGGRLMASNSRSNLVEPPTTIPSTLLISAWGELSCHIMTCPSSLLRDLFPVVTFMERRFGARRYEQALALLVFGPVPPR